ncbi:tripartite motif-containing protein 3-like [Patiria miniata]|uniref:Tripartite motif-containing protein 2-like n=1 Tax=Patiria miniata TaxID=46514 RepID=A0A914B9J4_PATMI|nr:tripartite motif-containing protein 3-like [Patiria miniata]
MLYFDRTTGNIESMAVGGTHRSILMKFGKEHLQCSICQDFLKTPKTLSCLHSFCEECLFLYQKSPQRSILCPLCRKETSSPKGGVRKLVTDFKLACMIEEVVRAKDTQTIPTCSSHAGRKCVVFCETCCELICLTCLTKSNRHRKHEVGEVSQETEVARKRQLMTEHQAKYEEKLAENDVALTTAGVLGKDLSKVVQKLRKEVEVKANEETAKIAAAKKCLLDDIHQFEKERERLLNGYTEDLKSRKETLQQIIGHSENVLHLCNDYEFLRGFSRVSSDLRVFTAHPDPNIDENVSVLEFRPSTPLGSTYLGSLLRTTQWKLRAESSHSKNSGGRGVTTGRDGSVLVADLWNRQIVTFASSESLPTFKSIKTRPRDVAVTNHHLVVVDDTAFVKMFSLTESGAHFQFPTVPCEVSNDHVDLRSVAVDGSGHIVVGDVKRKVLTEHKPRDGAIVRVLQLETPPEFLAINSVSHTLVSGEYSGIAQGVNQGDTVFTIMPTIKGTRVRCCTGVSWGKHGLIYIAMHNKTTGSGHVHMYDALGRFVKCIIQGLYLPQGIGLTEDDKQIVVADYDNIKVYTKENLQT